MHRGGRKDFWLGHHMWNSIQMCVCTVCILLILCFTLFGISMFMLSKCLGRESRQVLSFY